MAHDQTAAKTILAQLGGRRFVTMTGASSFSSDAAALSFRVPARLTKGRVSGVVITLTDADDYRIETVKMAGSLAKGDLRAERVTAADGVYCDTLREAFERVTGLATSLGSMGR